jgi:hypothetical protein
MTDVSANLAHLQIGGVSGPSLWSRHPPRALQRRPHSTRSTAATNALLNALVAQMHQLDPFSEAQSLSGSAPLVQSQRLPISGHLGATRAAPATAATSASATANMGSTRRYDGNLSLRALPASLRAGAESLLPSNQLFANEFIPFGASLSNPLTNNDTTDTYQVHNNNSNDSSSIVVRRPYSAAASSCDTSGFTYTLTSLGGNPTPSIPSAPVDAAPRVPTPPIPTIPLSEKINHTLGGKRSVSLSRVSVPLSHRNEEPLPYSDSILPYQTRRLITETVVLQQSSLPTNMSNNMNGGGALDNMVPPITLPSSPEVPFGPFVDPLLENIHSSTTTVGLSSLSLRRRTRSPIRNVLVLQPKYSLAAPTQLRPLVRAVNMTNTHAYGHGNDEWSTSISMTSSLPATARQTSRHQQRSNKSGNPSRPHTAAVDSSSSSSKIGISRHDRARLMRLVPDRFQYQRDNPHSQIY